MHAVWCSRRPAHGWGGILSWVGWGDNGSGGITALVAANSVQTGSHGRWQLNGGKKRNAVMYFPKAWAARTIVPVVWRTPSQILRSTSYSSPLVRCWVTSP